MSPEHDGIEQHERLSKGDAIAPVETVCEPPHRGRARGEFKVRGGIVPPGTLAPNRAHPKPPRTPEERLVAARLALGRVILRVVDYEQASPVDVVRDGIKED